MLDENYDFHRRVMENHVVFDLVGRVVCVDNKIKGYTFGTALNDKVFCVILEVVDLNMKGLASYISREFCNDVSLRRFAFINAMDDSEIMSLRLAKMSYHPTILMPSYVVRRKIL